METMNRQAFFAFFPRRRCVGAFSLIEVVMAMGIAAFALIAIASTLPVGLQSMRDSQNDQAIGTLQSQVRGSLQQISWSTTPTIFQLTGSNSYFTVEGVPTTTTSAVLPAYYRAQYAVSNAAVNRAPFGLSGANPTNAAIVTVTLSYPYPAYVWTNRFSMLATRQVGN